MPSPTQLSPFGFFSSHVFEVSSQKRPATQSVSSAQLLGQAPFEPLQTYPGHIGSPDDPASASVQLPSWPNSAQDSQAPVHAV